MKKYIVAVMMFVMAISTLVYANEDSMVFTIEPSANEGIVKVDIKYSNNIYMYGGGIVLKYDDSKLSIIEAVEGDALNKALSAINDKKEIGRVRMAWASVTVLPQNGVLMTAEFKLNSGEFKDSDITFEKVSAANKNGGKIKNIKVRVAGVESQAPMVSGKTDPKPENKPDNKNESDSDNKKTDTNAGMPKKDDKTEATLPIDTALNDTPVFEDVSQNDWFFESIKYVCDEGIMGGVSETEFDPNAELTRSMLVVVLYRLDGEPASSEPNFADVEKDTWYTKAVGWAAENGIVTGYSNTEFAPAANITREQFATIIYRYAKIKGYDLSVDESINILEYDDANEVSDYATDAMLYVCNKGLITGKTQSTLNPKDSATRAETATILYRFLETVK